MFASALVMILGLDAAVSAGHGAAAVAGGPAFALQALQALPSPIAVAGGAVAGGPAFALQEAQPAIATQPAR